MAHSKRRKESPRPAALSTLAAVLSGGAVAWLTGGLVLLLGAFLLWSGRAPESTAAHFCLAAGALGSLLGGAWSQRSRKERILPAALGAALLGAALWLLTGALALDGAGMRAAAVLLPTALAGGVAAAVLCRR